MTMVTDRQKAICERIDEFIRDFRSEDKAIRPSSDSDEQKELVDSLIESMRKYEMFKGFVEEDQKKPPLDLHDAEQVVTLRRVGKSTDKDETFFEYLTDKEYREAVKLWQEDVEQRANNKLNMYGAALDCDSLLDRATAYAMIKPGDNLILKLKECQEKNAELETDNKKLSKAYETLRTEFAEYRKRVLPPK